MTSRKKNLNLGEAVIALAAIAAVVYLIVTGHGEWVFWGVFIFCIFKAA